MGIVSPIYFKNYQIKKINDTCRTVEAVVSHVEIKREQKSMISCEKNGIHDLQVPRRSRKKMSKFKHVFRIKIGRARNIIFFNLLTENTPFRKIVF